MADATTQEGHISTALPMTGYLETSGNTIYDEETGEAVRLVGVNWHGGESVDRVPGGLWARNYKDMMDEMAELGLNTIRLPISPAVLDNTKVSDGIRFDLNPDLKGLTGIEVVDKIVKYADELGIRIIIDMHRITPGVGKEEDGLWFNNQYSENDLIDDWKEIASRYADNPTVVGFDLFNEPSGDAHWNEGPNKTDWHRAAEKIGNAVLNVNPDALIFVEGVHIVDGQWYWVGGNLSGAEDDPIELNVDDKLVYSPHDYPYSVQNVPWLEGANAAQMRANFNEHWGYLFKDGTAPVVIGETGGRQFNNSGQRIQDDKLYFETLTQYLKNSQTNGEGGMGILWWTWGPNSGDTGGLLSDWYTIDQSKYQYLEQLLDDPLPTTFKAVKNLNGETMTFLFEQTNNVNKERVYYYETRDGTAKAGADYVGKSGVIHLKAGETVAEIDISITADKLYSEATENFYVDIYYVNGTKFDTLQGKILNNSIKNPGDAPVNDPGGDVVVPPPVNDTVEMPDALLSADATRVFNFSDGSLTLQAEESNVGTVYVVGTYQRYDGSTFYNVDLRFEGHDRSFFEFGDAAETENKPNNGLLVSPADGLATPIDEYRFDFEYVPETREFDPSVNDIDLGFQWIGRKTGQGEGETTLDGIVSTRGKLEVTMELNDIWASGEFHASVTVKNTSNTDLGNWGITMNAEEFEFINGKVYKANYTHIDNDSIYMRPVDWNSVLFGKESYTFSFNGRVDPSEMLQISAETFLDHLDVLQV